MPLVLYFDQGLRGRHSVARARYTDPAGSRPKRAYLWEFDAKMQFMIDEYDYVQINTAKYRRDTSQIRTETQSASTSVYRTIEYLRAAYNRNFIHHE